MFSSHTAALEKPLNKPAHLTQVQLVTSIINSLKLSGNNQTAKLFVAAQHFEIDLEIYIAAGRFIWEMADGGEFFVDSISRPPANPAAFRLGDENSIYFMQTDGVTVQVDQVGLDGQCYRRFGWRLGTNKIDSRSYFETPSEQVDVQLHLTALSLSMMLSLINSPKLVEVLGGGQRQERRAADRSHSLPVDAWHKITWRTAAGRNVEDPGPADTTTKMPLHYRRGHVRTAQGHFAGAFETGLTETGWAQWIDGQWVGHPAFGIKQSIHSPKLDQEGLMNFMNRKKQKQ